MKSDARQALDATLSTMIVEAMMRVANGETDIAAVLAEDGRWTAAEVIEFLPEVERALCLDPSGAPA